MVWIPSLPCAFAEDLDVPITRRREKINIKLEGDKLYIERDK